MSRGSPDTDSRPSPRSSRAPSSSRSAPRCAPWPPVASPCATSPWVTSVPRSSAFRRHCWKESSRRCEPLRRARLLVLNSPLNPTGTLLDAPTLEAICDVVLEENARRERAAAGERPLYLLYDQVYWMLTFGGAAHVNPVSLRPAMEPYTILVDAI